MTSKWNKATVFFCITLFIVAHSTIALSASLDKVEEYLGAGYYMDAIREVDVFIADNPVDPLGYLFKGNILLTLALSPSQSHGEYVDTDPISILNYLGKAKTYSTTNDRTYLHSSLLESFTLMSWGLHEEAFANAYHAIVEPFEKGQHTHENIVIDALFLIAQCFEIDRDYNSAADVHNTLLTDYELDPEDHFTAVFNRAGLTTKGNDLNLLHQTYMDIINLYGNRSMTHQTELMGTVYTYEYTYEEAALYYLGDALFGRKENRMAKEVFETLMEKYPNGHFSEQARVTVMFMR